MENIKKWIAEHPYATGAIVLGAGLLFLILRSGGSNSTSSSGPTQASVALAQLNTAAQLQAMQIQAGQNVAAAQASVASQQIAAALAAKKLDTDASVTVNLADINSKVSMAGLQEDFLKTALQESTKQQLSNNQLAQYAIGQQYDLAKKGVEFGKLDNRGNIGANIVALALGQGNIASFNQANAASNIAGSSMWASIFGSLFGSAGSALTGIFG